MKKTCAVCDRPSEGEYAIHRYGMGIGPEVALCNSCGSGPIPTCGQIWAYLCNKRLPMSAFYRTQKRKTQKKAKKRKKVSKK